ncbi:MAG: ATP-binding protein, partial [Myxococcota bacterium]|nr:ATP-binding protein [Myxococcota bacterium]
MTDVDILLAAVGAQARVLKLPTVGHDCDPLARQALAEAWPPLQYLRSLLDAELATRAERAIERRLHAARLPAQKTLAQFDWKRAHGLERARVEELGRCAWIPTARNVVLLGPVGTGRRSARPSWRRLKDAPVTRSRVTPSIAPTSSRSSPRTRSSCCPPFAEASVTRGSCASLSMVARRIRLRGVSMSRAAYVPPATPAVIQKLLDEGRITPLEAQMGETPSFADGSLVTAPRRSSHWDAPMHVP